MKGKPICLFSDANNYTVRAVLEQEGRNGQCHIVANGSCSPICTKREWSLIQKECFVVHTLHEPLVASIPLGAKFKVVAGCARAAAVAATHCI